MSTKVWCTFYASIEIGLRRRFNKRGHGKREMIKVSGKEKEELCGSCENGFLQLAQNKIQQQK